MQNVQLMGQPVGFGSAFAVSPASPLQGGVQLLQPTTSAQAAPSGHYNLPSTTATSVQMPTPQQQYQQQPQQQPQPQQQQQQQRTINDFDLLFG